MVLAAGLGLRLRPLTETTPKCLLPLGGKPMLEWWLQKLAGLGVEEAFVNGHHLFEKVHDYVTKRPGPPAVSFAHEARLRGSAGTIASLAGKLAGEPFWICYADTWIGDDLTPLAAKHEQSAPAMTLGVFKTARPKKCGILELDVHGRVISFVEKPVVPRSNLAFAGVALAGPRLLARLPKSAFKFPLDLGKHVLPQMVDEGLCAVELARVIDIGTPESYERARRELA